MSLETIAQVSVMFNILFLCIIARQMVVLLDRSK